MANESTQKHVFTGVFIPAKIWLHPDFTPIEKMMIGEIKALGEETGWCYAGNAHFAKWLKCSPQNISIYVNSFKKQGFIDVKFSDEKTHAGRKMRVNLAWYHSIPNPLSPAVPPLSPAVPPLSPAVTDIHFKDTSKLSVEGEREDEKTTPTPADYDEMMERVNAETRDVEEKEKGVNPVAPHPPTVHAGFDEVFDYLESQNPGMFNVLQSPVLIQSFDTKTIPGSMIRTAEILPPMNGTEIIIKTGINEDGEVYVFEQSYPVNIPTGPTFAPTNPNATTALFNRMNLTPQATNGDEADAILTKWAAENIETVKFKYARAKRKFTAEDLDRLIVKFCGQYASNKDTGTRERFLFDPARFFNDKLSAWLADQPGFEKMLEPKNGFTQPETKSNLPKSIRRY
jgi:hypothetical protein